MYVLVQELMQWRVDLLLADRHEDLAREDLAREYVYPLALYMKDKQLVIRDAKLFVALTAKLRKSQREAGLVRIVAKMTAIDLPCNGRFRVWVTCCEYAANGAVVGQTDTVIYCRETAHRIRTEMQQCGRCSVPHIWEEDQFTVSLLGGKVV